MLRRGSTLRQLGFPTRGASFGFASALALVILLAPGAVAVPRAAAEALGESRLIAFQTDRDGNHEIYVMNEDGSDQRNVTRHAAADMVPKWSPNGAQIAFASKRAGSWDVWVINADGSNPRRVTTGRTSEFAPAWSPDGRRLAFTGNAGGDWEIYVVDAAGKGSATNVSNSPELEDLNPDWAPRTNEVVFQSGLFGEEGFTLRIVDVAARKPRGLPRRAVDEVNPAWSPASRTKIAYARLVGENYGVYVTDPAGRARQVFVDFARSEEADPAWSPDGKSIAFTGTRTGDYEIYSIAPGSPAQNLTHAPESDELHPAWRPRGTRFVVRGGRAVTRPPSRSLQASLACGSGTINGTAGNDLGLCGSGGADTINGLAKDDKMKGYGGADVLHGDKVLDGTQGRDWFWGGDGDDELWARDGRADCTVHGGNNTDAARIDSGLDPVLYLEAYF